MNCSGASIHTAHRRLGRRAVPAAVLAVAALATTPVMAQGKTVLDFWVPMTLGPGSTVSAVQKDGTDCLYTMQVPKARSASCGSVVEFTDLQVQWRAACGQAAEGSPVAGGLLTRYHKMAEQLGLPSNLVDITFDLRVVSASTWRPGPLAVPLDSAIDHLRIGTPGVDAVHLRIDTVQQGRGRDVMSGAEARRLFDPKGPLSDCRVWGDPHVDHKDGTRWN